MTYRSLSAISQLVQHRAAPGTGLLFTTGSPEKTLLLASGAEVIEAVFLFGERRFHSFPIKASTSIATSLYFADPVIEVDFSSAYDAASKSDPPGSIIVGSGNVHVAVAAERFDDELGYLPLWGPTPLCVGMANAGFTRWRLRHQNDEDGASLVEIDAGVRA